MQSTDIPINAIRWNLDFNDMVKSIDQKPKNTYYTAENDIVKLATNNVKGITSKDATIIILKQAVYSEANFNSNAPNDHVPFSVKFTGQERFFIEDRTDLPKIFSIYWRS